VARPPNPPDWTKRKVFTSGDVARLCGVTIKTVGNWIDSGQLRGRRVPGSLHRRVDRPELIGFLTEQGAEYALRALGVDPKAPRGA
jgi:hypothetical protein